MNPNSKQTALLWCNVFYSILGFSNFGIFTRPPLVVRKEVLRIRPEHHNPSHSRSHSKSQNSSNPLTKQSICCSSYPPQSDDMRTLAAGCLVALFSPIFQPAARYRRMPSPVRKISIEKGKQIYRCGCFCDQILEIATDRLTGQQLGYGCTLPCSASIHTSYVQHDGLVNVAHSSFLDRCHEKQRYFGLYFRTRSSAL